MFHWIHHLLNPHCTECANARKCVTCDVYEFELQKAQRLNEQLLAKLLEKPAPPIETTPKLEQATVGKSLMSWTQRRQILEAESRDAARKLQERENQIVPSVSVEQIEKELGVTQ